MDSRDLIRDLLDHGDVTDIARQAHTSRSMLHKWHQRGDHARTNPIEHLGGLYRATGDRRLLDALCAEADGTFVPNPPPRPGLDGENLSRAMARFHRAYDELDLLYAAGEEHDGFTAEQVARARERVEHLKATLENLQRSLEAGRHRRPPKLPLLVPSLLWPIVCEWLETMMALAA